MKKMTMLIVVLATFTIASCGGSSTGGGGDTPTPTTTDTNTKAVSEATVAATNAATTAATMNGLADMDAAPAINNSLSGKEAISANINYTYNCTQGTVVATGTMTASCDGSDSTWSCTSIALNLALQFNDCTETVTVDGTQYTVMLNGDGTSTASGTASGNNSGLTSLNISAVASGTLDATGDATGTVTLDLDVTVSGAPVPSATCSGTASVVTDEVTEVCGVTSDCSGCEA